MSFLLLLLSVGSSLVLQLNSGQEIVLEHRIADFGKTSDFDLTGPVKFLGLFCCNTSNAFSNSLESNFIAVIEEGECYFQQKVKNAYDIGAIAVVVYGNSSYSDATELVSMSTRSNEPQPPIPAVFVRSTDWITLSQAVNATLDKRGNTPYVPPNNTRRIAGLIFLVLLLVIACPIVVVLLSIPLNILWRRIWALTLASRIVGREFDSIDHDQIRETTCSICLEDFSPADQVKSLPVCNHVFHSACIDPWLRANDICPICRTVINV